MTEFLLAVLAVMLTWVVLVVTALIVLRWRLQRRNRVSPAVKSPAPTIWLWSPTRPAQLHRRLQLAVGEISTAPSRRARPAPSLSVDELQRDLEYQAVELDRHVVVASRHPRRQRRVLLADLDPRVAQVEELSVRLSRLRRPPGTPATGWDLPAGSNEMLNRISAQLDLLDQAQDELTAIERAAGLVDVDRLALPTLEPIARPLPPPPGAPWQPRPMPVRRPR